MKEINSLAPSLWRTCRVMASHKRLHCLHTVLRTPGLTVELVAGVTGLSASKASLSLRAIQSRGLISSRRKSRWNLYYSEPEASVKSSKAFLDAVRSAFFTEHLSEAEIVNALKAYTHSRRIDIVRQLAYADFVDFHNFSVKVQISPPALFRHLRYLRIHGVIELEEDSYKLAKPKTDFAHDLLRIILA